MQQTVTELFIYKNKKTYLRTMAAVAAVSERFWPEMINPKLRRERGPQVRSVLRLKTRSIAALAAFISAFFFSLKGLCQIPFN